MEGGGERVVVVRGLRDAGVAITLINDVPFKGRCSFGGSRSPTRIVSNVETNTDQFYHDSAVQIDGCRIVDQDGYYMSPTFRNEHPQRSPVLSRMFHSVDAFAGSLRKYPITSNLEKSQSAEIVQRILTYAQGRNFGKKSKSKSMRSLLRRCSTHRHVGKRKCGNSSSCNLWPGNRQECVDDRQDDCDLRYNYLNATMSKPGIEVRYLTGVKRALCEKLRDMCDDSPKICPRMQARYNHHKKHCNQGVAFAPAIQKPSKACFCHSPRQCVCEKNTDKLETHKQIEDELLKMFPDLVHTSHLPFNKKKDLETVVEDEVTSWVNNILPFYNVTLMSDSEKNQLIDNLVRGLHNIDRTDSIEAINRIKNCLNGLPALRDYEHRDTLINELSDNLLKKLRFAVDEHKVQDNVDKLVDKMLSKSNISDHNKDMIKKAVVHKLKPMLMNRALPEKDLEGFLTEEILDVVQKLPLDPTEISEEFREKLNSIQQKQELSPNLKEKEEMVLDWMKSFPELEDLPLAEKKKLIAPLVASLAKEERPEKMKTVIKDWLNDVINKDDRRLSAKSMNKLSKKLMAKLLPSEGDKIEISPNDSYDGKIPQAKDTVDTVMSWFQDIPELAFKNTPENNRAVEDLASKLKDIQQRYSNADDVQIESRKEIGNWLKDMMKKNNIYLHPETVDNLVNRLVNDLQESEQPKRFKSRLRKNKFYKEIWTWLTQLPYVDLQKVDKYKKYVAKLASNLENIESTKYDAQSLEQVVNNEVSKTLNILSETGLEIYENDKQNLIKIILNKLESTPRGRKKWHKTKTLKKGIQDAVANTLDRFPSTLLNKDTITNGISDLLHKHVKSDKMDPKKTKAQIVKYLEKNTKLPSSDIDNIANDIMHKVKQIPKAGFQKKRSALSPKLSDQEYYKSGSISDEVIEEELEEDGYDDISEKSDRPLTYGLRGDRKRFVTSTPEREINTSLDSTLSVPPIRDETYKNKDDVDESISQQEKIKDVLKDWLHDLDIDDDMKSKIIDDLTEDIIDRQRYLKLSNTKTSSIIELEHLKFQIFKRLNKIVSDKDLSKCMAKIRHLKTRLNAIQPSEDSNYETVESLLYKQQIQLIISQSVPATVNDDSFEELKNNLADAFVSLHYVSEDEGERSKYKRVIYEEINKYCHEYLKRYPASKLDPQKLNRDLYSALIKVPAPQKELLEPSFHITKIQNEIRNWLTEISTDKSPLKTESTRSSISLLANHLYSIQEKHKSQPNVNMKEEMLKAILDWLEQFPMTSGHKVDIKNGVKILYNNITKTPNIKQPQENIFYRSGQNKENDSVNINVTAHNAPVTSSTMKRVNNGTQYTPYIPPPSMLSAEDRAHLDMIRARSPTSVRRETHYHIHKDASNDPQPINISTQTDVAVNANEKQTRDSAVTQTVHEPNVTTREANFNVDVSPHVIVKEYLWNSTDSRQGSTIYTPRNNTINISTPPAPPINTGAPVNVVTHNQYPPPPSFQPLIPPVNKQRNVMAQSTNVTTQNNSGQHQEQAPSMHITKRTYTYNPEFNRRERPPVIHEKISQTHIERQQQRGYFINTPNYENFSRNQRPVLSGYLTPNEQAKHLERTRQFGDRFEHVRGYREPFIEEQEVPGRMYRRHDRYEMKHLGQKCCKCGGRVMTKCRASRPNYRHGDDFKMCSKCFGRHCPHPSPLYFNSEF
ncbi:unnamed protein product [Colias eurytheme]|nr:unnamed protein product [Colias eurytheme]